MEGKVTVEVVMKDGVVFSSGVGRVDGFHAGIEADDEEVGIHAETNAVTEGYFFPECAETELATRLVFIFSDGPDVAGIDKGGSAEFPKQLGSIFEAEVKFDVT